MSTTARTTKQLDALIKRGEAQSVKTLQELGRDYEKVKRSVSSDEIKNVSKLFETLRDDPNYNFRRTPLTLDEFDVMYNRMHGSSPSEAATNYFKALRDINDVDYYMNADALLKEAINNKETMIKLDGIFYRSKKVSYNSIEEGHPVYDATTGRLVKLNTAMSICSGQLQRSLRDTDRLGSNAGPGLVERPHGNNKSCPFPPSKKVSAWYLSIIKN